VTDTRWGLMAVPLFACGSLLVRIVLSATEVPLALLNATCKSFCVLAQLVELKLPFDGGSHIPDSSGTASKTPVG